MVEKKRGGKAPPKHKDAAQKIEHNEEVFKQTRFAKEGNLQALKSLASIYENGIGVKKNYKRSPELKDEFYKKYRKNCFKIDIVDFLIAFDEQHYKEGNHKKAAEKYFEAGFSYYK